LPGILRRGLKCTLHGFGGVPVAAVEALALAHSQNPITGLVT